MHAGAHWRKAPQGCGLVCAGRCTWHTRAGWSDLKCCLAARYARLDDSTMLRLLMLLSACRASVAMATDWRPCFRCEIAYTSSGAGADGSACVHCTWVERDIVYGTPWNAFARQMAHSTFVEWFDILHRLITAERRKITAIMRRMAIWYDIDRRNEKTCARCRDWPAQFLKTRWNKYLNIAFKNKNVPRAIRLNTTGHAVSWGEAYVVSFW